MYSPSDFLQENIELKSLIAILIVILERGLLVEVDLREGWHVLSMMLKILSWNVWGLMIPINIFGLRIYFVI